MGQVLREMNQNPPSGRLRYNLGDYIRQKGLCKTGMSVGKFRPWLIELTSFKPKLLIKFIIDKTC